MNLIFLVILLHLCIYIVVYFTGLRFDYSYPLPDFGGASQLELIGGMFLVVHKVQLKMTQVELMYIIKRKSIMGW